MLVNNSSRMFFVFTLILFVNLVSLQPLSLLVRECDQFEKVEIDTIVPVVNPNFPSSYDPGSICRWVFKCHVGYACRLVCRGLGLPSSEGCFMDKILVSSNSADPSEDGSRVYCGGMTVNTKSVGSTISMMLVASKESLGGRFMCTVRSEPTIHSRRSYEDRR